MNCGSLKTKDNIFVNSKLDTWIELSILLHKYYILNRNILQLIVNCFSNFSAAVSHFLLHALTG